MKKRKKKKKKYEKNKKILAYYKFGLVRGRGPNHSPFLGPLYIKEKEILIKICFWVGISLIFHIKLISFKIDQSLK